METITEIPFVLDVEQITSQAHIEHESNEAAELRSLIELAQQVGNPKAAYAVCFTEERSGDTIKIGDVFFKSQMLARNLETVERVFPILATCGHELDNAFTDNGDFLKEFWWDMIKGILLNTALEHLIAFLRRRFKLRKTATMHPGSADRNVWPIEQQQGLFKLLRDAGDRIGVRLTESFLMIPNKTISGIMFPTVTDFHSCEVCNREGCPSRTAPFNPEYNHDRCKA